VPLTYRIPLECVVFIALRGTV